MYFVNLANISNNFMPRKYYEYLHIARL